MSTLVKLGVFGAIAGIAYLTREKDVEIKNGIRVLSEEARHRVASALRGTNTGADTGPEFFGVFAMSIHSPTDPGGTGPDTIRFIDGVLDDGMSVLFTDSILKLKPGENPHSLGVVLIAIDPSNRDIAAEGKPFVAFN